MGPTGTSLYQQLRQIEFSLNRLWNDTDIVQLDSPARRALETVRRQIRVAQTTAKDYELSEAEEDVKAQLKHLPRLIKALEQTRMAILKASEYDLIGAVDVAQQTSQLDTLIERLR